VLNAGGRREPQADRYVHAANTRRRHRSIGMGPIGRGKHLSPFGPADTASTRTAPPTAPHVRRLRVTSSDSLPLSFDRTTGRSVNRSLFLTPMRLAVEQFDPSYIPSRAVDSTSIRLPFICAYAENRRANTKLFTT